MTNKKDVGRRQARLAENFKAERVRLGMTRRAVAGICGVTETAVVNWEHGGAKIPLVALELLAPSGFSPENLIEFPQGTAVVRKLGSDGETEGWVHIDEHMLARYSATKERVFFYCGTSTWDFQEYAHGRAGLFASLPDDAEILKDVSGLMLLKRRRGARAFLCEIDPAGKKGIRVSAGGVKKSMAAEKLHHACRPIGLYLGPADENAAAGSRKERKQSPHEQELRKATG